MSDRLTYSLTIGEFEKYKKEQEEKHKREREEFEKRLAAMEARLLSFGVEKTTTTPVAPPAIAPLPVVQPTEELAKKNAELERKNEELARELAAIKMSIAYPPAPYQLPPQMYQPTYPQAYAYPAPTANYQVGTQQAAPQQATPQQTNPFSTASVLATSTPPPHQTQQRTTNRSQNKPGMYAETVQKFAQD